MTMKNLYKETCRAAEKMPSLAMSRQGSANGGNAFSTKLLVRIPLKA